VCKGKLLSRPEYSLSQLNSGFPLDCYEDRQLADFLRFQAFADGYAILERKLHDISTGSEDVQDGLERLQLLQLLLPCIVAK
jgi:hypothetical protein